MNDSIATVLPALRRLIVDHFEVPEETLDDQTPFTALGLDSLGLVDMMFQVEDLYHVSIDHDEAMADPTLQGLARLVVRLRGQALSQAA